MLSSLLLLLNPQALRLVEEVIMLNISCANILCVLTFEKIPLN